MTIHALVGRMVIVVAQSSCEVYNLLTGRPVVELFNHFRSHVFNCPGGQCPDVAMFLRIYWPLHFITTALSKHNVTRVGAANTGSPLVLIKQMIRIQWRANYFLWKKSFLGVSIIARVVASASMGVRVIGICSVCCSHIIMWNCKCNVTWQIHEFFLFSFSFSSSS